MKHQFFKICTISALIITSNYLAAETIQGNQPRLSVSAQATIFKPADQLQLSIGVITLNDTAEEALAENSDRMDAIITSLESAGLQQAEYKTGNFSIRPTYSPYPKNPPPNWKSTITGYEVSNSLSIQTQKLEIVGKLIDAASKAGANNIENIHFNLHDPRMHWDEAISQATTNAAHDARIIASAANVKLGRPLSISLENQQVVVPRALGFAKMSAESVPPIEAGNIEISAAVNIVYEID